MHNKTITI